MGMWKINLMVRAENKAVGGFYESLGYAINPILSLGKRID
jgi:ribosomal protein S18 acetylase RimI-like enzyme